MRPSLPAQSGFFRTRPTGARTSYPCDMPINETVPESGSDIAAAGVDLVAIGTSFVPVAGGPMAALLQGLSNRKFRRRIRYLEALCKNLGCRVEVLEKRMAGDEDDAELVEEAAGYADHCRSEEGLSLMGCIVAAGLSSTAESSRGIAHLLLDAVGRLAPEHLALIREFAMLRYASQDPDRWHPGNRERGRQSLVHFLPGLAELIDPLLGHLEAAGLIRRWDREQETVTRFTDRRDVQWGLTTFGVQIARYLGPDDKGAPTSTEPTSAPVDSEAYQATRAATAKFGATRANTGPDTTTTDPQVTGPTEAL